MNQAWLWKLGECYLCTIPAKYRANAATAPLPKFNGAFDPFQGTVFRIGVLLSQLVDDLGRLETFGMSLSVLDIFERSITALSEDIKKYLKSTDEESFQIDEEKRYFHEIGDIREELSMIKMVFLQQEEVWNDFKATAWPEYCKDSSTVFPTEPPNVMYARSWRAISYTSVQLRKFKEQIERLDEHAGRVEQVISINLDLKQKFASMRQAEASIKEAHSAALMSAAVFGFTVITIIFTPLSFILALFALPIDQFQQHQKNSSSIEGTKMYTTNYIGKWAGEIIQFNAI